MKEISISSSQTSFNELDRIDETITSGTLPEVKASNVNDSKNNVDDDSLYVPSFIDLIGDSDDKLSGDKLDMKQVLNKEIVVTGYEINNSKYASEKCLKLQYYFDNDKTQTRYILFTGSKVLISQINKVSENCKTKSIPLKFVTSIKSRDRCYFFT